MSPADTIKGNPACPKCSGKGIGGKNAAGKEVPCMCIRTAVAKAGWSRYRYAKGVATRDDGKPAPAPDGDA